MSSVLETFLILFESNADDVDKGAKQAEKSTDDLEKKLNSTQGATDKLGSSFLLMARSAAGAIAAFVTIGTVTAGVFASAQYADRLQETAEAIGVNMNELEAWSQAAVMAGGSAEGLTGSVKNLAASMAQMDTLGKSKVQPFFKELGINMLDAAGRARPVLELFPEIAEAFESMSKQEAIGFGRKLGLDEGTIMLLQRGRREVEELIRRQKELGTVNERDAQIAAEYNDALDEMGHVFRVLFSRIAGDVLPAMTWLVEKFTAFGLWAREHKGFLYGFFATLTGFMTFFAAKAVIAAGAIMLINWPLYAIAAAALAVAAAFGLLWDDFQKFAEGGKALLGPLWEFLLKVEKVAASIVNLIKSILGAAWGGATIINKGIAEMVGAGQDAIATADASPIGSQTSNSIVGGARVNKETTVNIGEVKVETQATDANGMAAGLGIALGRQMRQTVSNMDDGVKG